ITKDWVNGRSLTEIADAYFADDTNDTKKLTAACRAIYRSIVNSGTWGISALSRLSGMNFDNLPEADRRRINLLPAMIYHGVRTENAVLMRMNSVPRSASENIGELFRETWIAEGGDATVQGARQFLRSMSDIQWDRVKPVGATLSGRDYRRVWSVLSG